MVGGRLKIEAELAVPNCYWLFSVITKMMTGGHKDNDENDDLPSPNV